MASATQGGLFGEDYSPSGKRVAPSASRAAVAERKRRFVAAQADIGELPAVADPERRARCSASLVAFAREYCMGVLLAREPSPRLEAYARRLQDSIDGAGFTHVRFPRGAGKTTWIKAAVAWGMATGRLRFPVCYGASAALATGILADVWNVFTASEAFAADFPEVSFPILAGGGSAQRWLSQTYHGVATNIRKAATEIRLPTIEGAASSGAVAKAFGAGSATRGLVVGSVRPDFVLLDDLQTRKIARSPGLVQNLAKWIQQDVLGLGGSKAVSVAMTSTPIQAGDLSEAFADAEQHPEWKTVEWPMVVSWPKRDDLWAEYLERRRECVRAGDTTFADATAFYEAHREAMDEGGDVLDPGAFDPRVERSALQRAYNLVATQGREAFDAEYQLKVPRPSASVTVTARLVASRVNGVERLTLPPGMSDVYASIDVNEVAGVSWTVTAFGPRQTAAVVDYGRYTGGRDRLVPEHSTERAKTNIVAAAIRHVLEHLARLRFPKSDGGTARLRVIWIDLGHMPETVKKEAAKASSALLLVNGSRGVNNLGFYRLKDQGARNAFGVKEGGNDNGNDPKALPSKLALDCEFRWFFQNADVWKECVQRAFLGEPLQDGSLSLFGGSPAEHEAFANEITSETLEEKLDTKHGVEYKWAYRPGVPNHWLDTTYGTFAIASFMGVYSYDDAEVAARKTRCVAETVPAESTSDPPRAGIGAPVRHRPPVAARPAFSLIVA